MVVRWRAAFYGNGNGVSNCNCNVNVNVNCSAAVLAAGSVREGWRDTP
ncbi:hypothetical protein [Stenotrophomonas rhizophila]|nr:hypothetical protein [Stenotrophomonas rhizophila]